MASSSSSIHAERSNLTSLDGMEATAEVEVLCVQENALQNFYGLPTFSKLKFLHADSNHITSFLGSSHQPSIEILTMEGNPICNHPHFRIMALLAVGESLRIVNYRVITEGERRTAEALGGCGGWAARCLCFGWTGLEVAERTSDWYSVLFDQLRDKYAAAVAQLDPSCCFGAVFGFSKSPHREGGRSPAAEASTAAPASSAQQRAQLTLEGLQMLRNKSGYRGPHHRVEVARPSAMPVNTHVGTLSTRDLSKRAASRSPLRPQASSLGQTSNSKAAKTALMMDQDEVGCLHSVMVHRVDVTLDLDGRTVLPDCRIGVVGVNATINIFEGPQSNVPHCTLSLIDDVDDVQLNKADGCITLTGVGEEGSRQTVEIRTRTSNKEQQAGAQAQGLFKLLMLFRCSSEELAEFYSSS